MENKKQKIRKLPTKKHPHRVRILMTEFVTHDAKRFIVEKPEDYEYLPGQATLLSIPNSKLADEFREFSITSSNQDQVLEFIIKAYSDHDGVTTQLHQLEPNDEVVLHAPFGTILYDGPGVFLAGGTGITPFISIMRNLHKNNQLKGNKLIFSNKEVKDIILEGELREMFGDDLILTLTRDDSENYEHGRINKEMILKYVKDMNQKFYVCGPDAFVFDMKKVLNDFGVDDENIVAESFIIADA